MLPTMIAAALTLTAQPPAIQISEDGRNFVTAQGESFFYLSDTAWTMTSRLTDPEIELYLSDRRRKGFDVIQIVLVPWGVRDSGNLAGDLPFLENDMARPNPAYFARVERILDRIEAYGFVPSVVPFWLAGLPEPGPEERAKHEAYARWLGERFGERSIFWLLGADRAPGGWAEIIRAFAAELERSAGRTDLLMTHHPQGGQSSSTWFHADPWMDFNMLQSGHNLDINHFALIDRDYALTPVKPVLDGEPAYENLTNALVPYQPGVRLVNGYDVRRQAYQSVFGGAAGHAYGACEVYEFHREGMGKARWTVGIDWKDALQLPGSTQVGHLARLIQSRSPLTRIPDQTLITSENPADHRRRIRALRCRNGSWAYVYTPMGDRFTLDLSRLQPGRLAAVWMDPRSGIELPAWIVPEGSPQDFTPPSSGPDQDWVLILDSIGKSG